MVTETRERITDTDRLSRLEGAHEHMATKADLAGLETRLTEKIVESEIRTAEKIAESNEKIAESEIRTAEKIAESEVRTAERIAEVNEKITESESRLIKWGVGIAASAFAAASALAALMYRLAASSP